MDRNEILDYVTDYVGEFADDFDLEAIADELEGRDLDGMDPDEFTDVLQRHDLKA